MKFKNKSFRSKIIAWTGTAIFFTVLILTSYTVLTVRKTLYKNAVQDIKSAGGNYINKLKIGYQDIITESEAFARLVEFSMKSQPAKLSREDMISMMVETTKSGTYPSMFIAITEGSYDGLDNKYRNTFGHDTSGVFIPSIFRDMKNEIHVTPNEFRWKSGYMEMHQLLKNVRDVVAFPPMYVSLSKLPSTPFVVPIFSNGEVIGGAGFSARVEFFQNYAVEAKNELVDFTADIEVISENGILMASTMKPDKVGTTLFSDRKEKSDSLLKYIAQGKETVKIVNDTLIVEMSFAAVGTGAFSQISIKVPRNEIIAKANHLMFTQILLGLIIAVVALAVIMWWVSRAMKPVVLVSEHLRKISHGILPDRIEPVCEREFNEMIESMNSLITANRDIIEKSKMFAEGALDVIFDQRSDEDGLMQALGNIVEMNKTIVQAARDISQGDLTVKLHKRSDKDELIENLMNMVTAIRDMIERVTSTAEGVSSASEELKSVAVQLSSGAAEQAATSEELSATLQEMTKRIKTNSEKSEEAKSITLKVVGNIESVAESVAETHDVMKSILNKIGKINDIAKKTDMLAINASIEAARAGDSGKGFAVVANQVRQLAELSTKAALEIESVSKKSYQKSEQSNKMLDVIVPEMKTTSELVGDVIGANVEQDISIKQVNQALIELSNVTHQNSSMSEEMSNNAEELSAQAEVAVDTVSFFTTEYSRRKERDANRIKSNIEQLQDQLNNLLTKERELLAGARIRSSSQSRGITLDVGDTEDASFEGFNS